MKTYDIISIIKVWKWEHVVIEGLFKKNPKLKGFTIVELLVVISVIAILATFTVVSFIGISENARKVSFTANAKSVLKSLQVKETSDDTFDPLSIDDSNVSSVLNIPADNFDSLSVNTLNNEDYVYIVGQAKFANLTACGTQGNLAVYNSDNADCALTGKSFVVAAVTDVTPGVFGGGNGSTCALAMTIDSIEDLIALSNSVNGGNTYSGKCIKLATSLDFSQNKSYVDYQTTALGDINGDGTTDGLKKELTTGNGFAPIGSSAHSFNGTMLDNANSIYDLYINRSTTAYVGLFGYNRGTITALTVENVNIIGADYTGAIAGYGDHGQITEIMATGNVTGNNYVGLAVGYFYADGNRITSMRTNGNVTGANNVGGIIGYVYAYNSTETVSGINEGGVITSTGAAVGRILGGSYNYAGGVKISGLSLQSAVTVNGSTKTSSSVTSSNGADIDSLSELDNINLAEVALDTYIGGDDDGNGYYWDYDGSNKLTFKNTTADPLTFGLAGSGTTAVPYIINNYTDLKQASLKLGSVYKLASDINLSGQKFYMIGSYMNNFTGTFNGNTKTISNLTINIPHGTYIGFVGYNRGTITALNLNDVDIAAKDFVGAVTGYADHGKITEIMTTGNVIGSNYVGLAVGYFYSDGNRITSMRTNGNVTGANNVGGIVGYVYAYNGTETVSGINEGGVITSTGAAVGRILGGSYNYAGGVKLSALALQPSVTVNGSTVTSTSSTSNNGADIVSLSELNDVNLAEVALDTYIGGDDDGNGYYWDYDGSNNLVFKDIAIDPLAFGLTGSGTTADPYLISNYNDLRQASQKLGSTFKLTANIDLNGKNFYMLGSYMNNFTGTLNGDAKTISHLTINSPHGTYMGLVGYNRGTITNMTLDSVNIAAKDFVGAVTGYADHGKITEVMTTGSVTGNNYIGLAVGYFYSDGNRITSMRTNGNVTGANNVGGIVGYVYAYNGTETVSGINEGGVITSTGAAVGRILGGSYNYAGGVKLSALALQPSVTVNGSTKTSSSSASNNGADIASLSELNDINLAEVALDTYIGGDDDGNGYYWDYDGSNNLVFKNISTDPLTFGLAGSGTTATPYLINNYTELKQASLKLGSVYKLASDIDIAGQKFYMIGSYMNNFTGTFNGNAKTISHLTINSPNGTYIGLIGYNRGTIVALNLSSVDITAKDYVGALAGYGDHGAIRDSMVTGNVTGNNYVGLAVGYFYADSNHITSITTQGNVTGANNVGGMVGYVYAYNGTDNIKAINKGGSIVSTGAAVGRIVGGKANYAGSVSISSAAISSVTINGSTVASASATSNNGLDLTLPDLAVSTTYTNRGFNFTDEVLDYIWYIDGSDAKFREGSL